MEFREILAEYLQLHSMTQTEFARRVGVRQSQVSEWLCGKAKPGYDTMRQIICAFELPASYWMGTD